MRDPTQRVVITGIGLASVFGQDPDVFYDKLLAGTSGASMIEKFDASAMSTQFAAYIKDYDVEGYIDRKNARRMDDCLKYAIVSSRQALEQAGLEKDGEVSGPGRGRAPAGARDPSGRVGGGGRRRR